jgi:outer membrane protein OmpA-like peptidoglycan-associated protein
MVDDAEFAAAERRLSGFTWDSTGLDTVASAPSNVALPHRRADAVRDPLRKFGVDASRLTAKGSGAVESHCG